MFDKICLVWAENASPAPWSTSPQISVLAWRDVIGSQWVRWLPGEIPDLSAYQICMVNLFPGSTHITEIRAAYPAMFIVAMPDPSLDVVLNTPEWVDLYRQMAIVDVIGGRTETDCQVYGTLLNKETFCLPSPVGPIEYFLPYRELPKEEYLITLDHQVAPANTVCNVAKVVHLQRKTNCRVVYVGAKDYTKEYATIAGLNAEWVDNCEFDAFAQLTAKARLCVDMYPTHSYGRQQVLCALVGTVCIGSAWCADGRINWEVDPFDIKEKIRHAVSFLARPKIGDYRREQAFKEVNWLYGFEASRARLNWIVKLKDKRDAH